MGRVAVGFEGPAIEEPSADPLVDPLAELVAIREVVGEGQLPRSEADCRNASYLRFCVTFESLGPSGAPGSLALLLHDCC